MPLRSLSTVKLEPGVGEGKVGVLVMVTGGTTVSVMVRGGTGVSVPVINEGGDAVGLA